MSDPLPADLRDLLALHLADGLGPQRIAALLEHFGSASAARRAGASQLRAVGGIGEQLASSLAAALPAVEVDDEIARLEKLGASVLALGRPGYPAALATIPAAPHLLFARGSLLPADDRAVAIVGTRHPDAYGKRVARQLAEGLARAGVTVISGLARGIDGIAHQGALDAGGRTLAVLGSGLGRLYPPEHKGLADRVASAGAVLSEYPAEQAPSRGTFPARNRIISGLSRVVIIVQAPADSGALITADHAADQGRTVLAVPGPVDGELHAGCHRLIRDGAGLCRGPDDVLEELDGVSAVATEAKRREKEPAAPAGPPPGLDEVQTRVWEFLAPGPRGGDEIARQVGLGVPQLAGVLLTLEMKKVLRRLPGNRYERA
jgi:DNA processing protein